MQVKEQKGKKIYSDGNEVEKEMLNIAKKYPGDLSQDYIKAESKYTVNNTFSLVRNNILNWYPFKKNAEILEIGAGMGAITGMLCDKAKRVTAIEMNEVRAEVIRTRCNNKNNLEVISEDINEWKSEKKYDYVIFIGVLEYAAVFLDNNEPFTRFLDNAKRFLKEDGILLFAIENQYGMKYWCGAAEDHLQKPFVGIDGYKEKNTPRTFSKAELGKMLNKVGLSEKRFYYVLPDYKFPTAIYTDEYKPSYNELQNISFTYSKGSQLIFNEKNLYKDIIENNKFDFFANSYLIEASRRALDKNHIIYATARGECKKEYKVLTTIDSNKVIRKRAAHESANKHIQEIINNTNELSSRNISIIKYRLENKELVSEYCDVPKADRIFERYLENNQIKEIYSLIDNLEKNILLSSEVSESKIGIIERLDLDKEKKLNSFGRILKKGYIDMTFYNAFYDDNKLIFFDQEWVFDEIPVSFILYYSLKSIYNRSNIETNITLCDLLEYIKVDKKEQEIYDKLEEYIWSTVLLRQEDNYGEDGYCNRYSKELELKYNVKQKINNEQIVADEKLRKLEEELKKEIAYEVEINNKINENNIKLVKEKEELVKINNENDKKNIKLIDEKEKLSEEIETIRNSNSWKLVSKFQPIARGVLPRGSKRRYFVWVLVKCIKMPFKVIRKITFKRLKNAFKYLKTEGLRSVIKRVDEIIVDNSIQEIELKDVKSIDENKKIEEYEKLVFEEYENPKVSIIIPVYNQFSYTYACLESVCRNSKGIEYEVIIANDCSTDSTTRLNEVVQGITIINNEKNLKFLKNCNNAVKEAKGKYILFLNNDTQVLENWLSSLIDLIERDSSIGMVGSKLIYPDGRLQEAGGIIWSDGSAWNYGNGKNGNSPEYNYVKEVDYISGASIMVKSDLLNQLNGFDEMYEPAYCEDSDLAFRIREKGYKVMFQPLSEVLHFEGVSNGTDTKEGQKAYQVINKNKFENKWSDILKKEQYKNAENVFCARDRSRDKPVLLMIDHYVPQYDKDAGSRTVFQYLKLFVKMGFNVKFIGDNFYKHEPYTTTLEQLGIEVLYGNYYAKNWEQWIYENKKNIKFVFLNRPHISAKYIDFIRNTTNAKIIYYGHDLHFLREMRKYELTGEKKALKDSNNWKEKEISLMNKADVIYYPSEVEVKEIKKIDKSINAKVLQAYIFEDVQKRNYDFKKRKDIMFVGGFVHTPNVDAVEWLAKSIMPELLKKISDVHVYILGSNPTDNIMKLQSDNLIIKGYVTDEELSEFYMNTRISIVPLRYGAGIKGKVIEAMKFGVPVITTSVGAEGIIGAEEILCVADDAEKIVEKIVDIYKDGFKLKNMSEKSIEYIQTNFSVESAIDKIEEDFNVSEELT